VQVGQIAAYGQSDAGAGPLLPLGDGRLMLRADHTGSDAARQMVAGERPDALGLYLLESFDKPVTERTERTVRETINAGGLVAWVIVGLGVLAILLSAIRAGLLTMAGRGQGLVDAIAEALRSGRLDDARAKVASGPTPTARVLRAILQAPLATDGDPREALQDVAATAILEEQPTIERFGALILVIAAVAPLLGLLGTVTGMIATFEIITEFGTGDPAMLSGGIGEALITTQLGLVVAIPAVLLGNVLKGRQNEVLRRLDHAALSIINLRTDHSPDGGNRRETPEKPHVRKASTAGAA
jgi:biopolymer transport protein ExbB